MGSTSFTRVAKVVVDEDGNVITKRVFLKKNLAGQIVKDIEYVEDENRAVTNRVVESEDLETTINQTIVTATNPLILKDLSDQLVTNSPGPYTIPATPKADTLLVFLNGQLLNDETTMTEDDEFIFINNFEEAIVADSSLYVSYIPLEA